MSQIKKASMIRMLLAAIFAVAAFALLPASSYAAEPDTFDTIQEYSTYASGEKLADSFYYTDNWFFEDPAARNDGLALLSMQLVAASVEEGADSPAADMLEKLGFDEVGFVGFTSIDPDDCGYVWGKKTITEGANTYTLIVVAVQSYSFNEDVKVKGWRQNFTVNGDGAGEASGEHYSFAKATDMAIDDIVGLGGTDQVKYWVCGHSRGGAIANLIAQRLPDRLGSSNAGVYAYTFESPATVDADAAGDSDSYAYIHNYLCDNDLVTKVPMWNMTRYGTEHTLNTDKADAGLVEELGKLESKAVKAEIIDGSEAIAKLVGGLESGIPTRVGYSQARSDSFVDESGAAVEITYSYQDVFGTLMDVITSGELAGLDRNAVVDNIGDLLPAVTVLADAVEKEQNGQLDEVLPLYWQAAKGVRAFLVEQLDGGVLSLSDEDFYVLLRLAGPIGINPAYEPTGVADDDVMGYIRPLADIATMADAMTYSHHFDTVIARLKTLAPQPMLADMDIVIEEPAGGDSADKAAAEMSAFIEETNNSWLSVEAAWKSADAVLEDDSVYYLEATLKAVGHLVSDDLDLTVNGQSPIQPLEISYEKGASIIRATWCFSIGDPADITVSFDAGGYMANPADITVKRGGTLQYVDVPDTEKTVVKDGKTWRLKGWYDKDGTTWEDVIVKEDMAMYAKWVLVVDDVQVFFEIPKEGSAIAAPTVAEGVPYHVSSWLIVDEDWQETDTIEEGKSYELAVYVALNDPSSSEFPIEDFGDDFLDFKGVMTINGKTTDVSCETATLLRGSYSFVGGAAEPVADVVYTVVEGDGQSWTKGSGVPAKFVVKRSADDEKTFDHFRSVSVDEQEIDAGLYSVEPGSVVLNLAAAYLETLSVGEHVLTVSFDDGSADAVFTIMEKAAAPEEPAAKDETSDNMPAMGDGNSWLVLMCSVSTMLSLIALAGCDLKRRREQ